MSRAEHHAVRSLHPVHAIFLAGSFPLFLGAFLSDWAYYSSFEIQWINFSAWLIVGALLFVGLALAWAVVDFLRSDIARDRRTSFYLLFLVAAFLIGFVNALIHAKDAWATMPAGLILSLILVPIILAAIWLGFSNLRRGDA